MMTEHLTATLLTAIVTSLWVGGLVALGAGWLVRCLPLGSAARSRVWTTALVITIAVPFIQSGALDLLPRSAPPAGGTPATSTVQAIAPPPAAGEPAVEETESVAAPPVGQEPPALSLDRSSGALLLLAWLVGMLVGLAWLARQVRALVQLKHTGAPADRDLAALWTGLLANGRHRSATLLLSTTSKLPAACGYFNPAVIAPESLCRMLNATETRHLLLHELAHLDRYDDWSLLAHRLVRALLWWHPVVWFIGHQLDGEREMACDERVAAEGNRRGYARTLVRVAEVARGATVELAPGVLRGDLTRRVEALLRRTRPVSAGRRVRTGTIAVATLGLAATVSPPAVELGGGDGDRAPQVVADHSGIANHLDSLLAGYADSGFAGSVLLAMDGQVILERGYGMADREQGVPATEATRYSVAGFTKMFTAAAILLLEQEGRLRVSDSLGRFFPQLSGREARVTLSQLLTHTDGLTRQNAPVYRSDPRQFIQAVATSPDSFAPGEGYRYNDFGHSILGLIVEQVSGMPYETFIHQRFLKPAGLAQTGFENEPVGPYAVEYAGPTGKQYPIPPRSYTWGRRGSLGLVSTTGDMHRWVQALNDPRIVPSSVREKMYQSYGPTDWRAERGYGWDRIRQRNGGVLWRRVAGTPGMEGEILHDPAGRWTAVILVNSRVDWRFRIWDDITSAVQREASAAEPR